MATFSDLRIDTAGLGYTLTARSPNLSSATSSAFNVTTPVPIRLPRRPIPDPLYGVTIDAIDHLPAILTSLSSLSRTATTRVVFDEFVPPSDYVDAVSQISRVSYVPCASRCRSTSVGISGGTVSKTSCRGPIRSGRSSTTRFAITRAEHIGGGPRLESNVSPTADPRDRGRISPSPGGSAT